MTTNNKNLINFISNNMYASYIRPICKQGASCDESVSIRVIVSPNLANNGK